MPNEGSYFFSKEAWEIIGQVALGYRKNIPEIFGRQRYFGCVSIIGCKGIITGVKFFSEKTYEDRSTQYCMSPGGFYGYKQRCALC